MTWKQAFFAAAVGAGAALVWLWLTNRDEAAGGKGVLSRIAKLWGAPTDGVKGGSTAYGESGCGCQKGC